MPPKDEKEEELQPKNQTDEALSIAELLDAERDVDRESIMEKRVQQYKHLKYVRIVIFFLIWLTATVILFLTKEETPDYNGTVVPVAGKVWPLKVQPEADMLTIRMKAPFQEVLSDIVDGRFRGLHLQELLEESNFKLIVQVQRTFKDENANVMMTETVSKSFNYSLMPPNSFDDLKVMRIRRENIIVLKPSSAGGAYSLKLQLENVDSPLPLEIKIFPSALNTPVSVILSAVLIAGMFVLFCWDAVSRGIVAMLFSTLTVALLGIYNYRQPLRELLNHVDLDIILLIFGLTLIICVFAETGGDLYMAVLFYRLSNGHIWPILTVMCFAVGFGSAFLNSTTILILVTSLAIRLSEILNLNLTSMLTCLILFSNTGYMLTRLGSPQESVLSQRGVIDYTQIFKSYGAFLMQMLLPIFLSMGMTYAYLRFYYGNSEKMRIVEPPIVTRLRNGIRFWSRTAQGMAGYTKEETALRQNMLFKVHRMRQRLRRLGKMPMPAENFQQHLQQLQEQHKIRDWVLLVKCCIVLFAVIVMQIAFTCKAHLLSPGWICILFSLVLLALASWQEFEALMAKIDWSTLITIACLLIIWRGLTPLGLMEAIGDSTVHMVGSISRRYRLNTATIMVLIATTFGSAFMDSQHVSFVMSTKALNMYRDPNFNIELDPLLFAVFLGAGFGKNTTLVSSIANIVCAGIAEKHGFKFYFWDYFKVGVVVTLGNIFLSIVYLLIFNAMMAYT